MQNDVSSGVVSVCPSYMWQCVKKCETEKKLRLRSASATLHYKVPGSFGFTQNDMEYLVVCVSDGW